jgi:hypothetical protein
MKRKQSTRNAPEWKQSKIDDLDIGILKIGQVRSFKYLGAIVNDDNSIEEEIQERRALGNKAHY